MEFRLTEFLWRTGIEGRDLDVSDDGEKGSRKVCLTILISDCIA